MRIHILGIGGSFMGSIAVLAHSMGWTVSGTDDQIFPPMSGVLEQLNIPVYHDWLQCLQSFYDCMVVGNSLSRSGKGGVLIEALLNRQIPFVSGPQWLYEYVLKNKKVIAVAGTHGKTFTTSLLAWILKTANMDVGFLIGGMPCNFGTHAHLGTSDFFVMEADEYDTAFFDKRSKFLHYRPYSLILNNLEFDHVDIFDNLATIQKQFVYLLRLIPADGKIIYSEEDANLKAVLKHAYTSLESAGIECGLWQAADLQMSSSQSLFTVYHNDIKIGQCMWRHCGRHYVHNAINAVAMASGLGVKFDAIVEALHTFAGVKRRLEFIPSDNGITIYDDFAHHPTAVAETIKALQLKIPNKTLTVGLCCETNTLKSGYYNSKLLDALSTADRAYLLTDSHNCALMQQEAHRHGSVKVFASASDAADFLKQTLKIGDHLLLMSTRSNESFLNEILAFKPHQ
jgi:UDP-N-acetylmuramate: L-alanyl-gamma-D-glutamyl-meso-diaminopimelate ligase